MTERSAGLNRCGCHGRNERAFLCAQEPICSLLRKVHSPPETHRENPGQVMVEPRRPVNLDSQTSTPTSRDSKGNPRKSLTDRSSDKKPQLSRPLGKLVMRRRGNAWFSNVSLKRMPVRAAESAVLRGFMGSCEPAEEKPTRPQACPKRRRPKEPAEGLR